MVDVNIVSRTLYVSPKMRIDIGGGMMQCNKKQKKIRRRKSNIQPHSRHYHSASFGRLETDSGTGLKWQIKPHRTWNGMKSVFFVDTRASKAPLVHPDHISQPVFLMEKQTQTDGRKFGLSDFKLIT